MRWNPISLALVLAIPACGPTAKNDPDGGNGSGSGNDDSGGGGNVDAAICGSQTEQIDTTQQGDPPDLLVVLDRSGSMRDSIDIFGPSKWDIMDGALTSVVTSKQTAIKFGVLEFPSDNNCAVDTAPEVPIQISGGAAVTNFFANRGPNGGTPAANSLQSALAYYSTLPVNPAGRYVMFATDGVPECPGNNDTNTVEAVSGLLNAGIKTFVLGFGSFGGTDLLNAAATAGGTARPGTKKFYEATSAAELDQALNDIAGGVIVPSCSYALATAPPEPDNVTVSVNGVPVPRDPNHAQGWDYHPDAMTITFFGTACDQIKSGAITDVKFEYGCPGPIIN
ncbi:MAG: vWA domain-containing protein [Kofleriaceae bacterium]